MCPAILHVISWISLMLPGTDPRHHPNEGKNSAKSLNEMRPKKASNWSG